MDERLVLVFCHVILASVETPDLGVFYKTRLIVHFSALVLSASAGLAYQLRTHNVTFASCVSAFLNSGLVGLSITLIGMATPLAAWPEAMVGVAILTGLGGVKTLKAVEKAGPEAIATILRSAAEKFSPSRVLRKGTGKHDSSEPPSGE